MKYVKSTYRSIQHFQVTSFARVWKWQVLPAKRVVSQSLSSITHNKQRSPRELMGRSTPETYMGQLFITQPGATHYLSNLFSPNSNQLNPWPVVWVKTICYDSWKSVLHHQYYYHIAVIICYYKETVFADPSFLASILAPNGTKPTRKWQNQTQAEPTHGMTKPMSTFKVKWSNPEMTTQHTSE